MIFAKHLSNIRRYFARTTGAKRNIFWHVCPFRVADCFLMSILLEDFHGSAGRKTFLFQMWVSVMAINGFGRYNTRNDCPMIRMYVDYNRKPYT